MSGFSVGSFSFSRSSHKRGGFLGGHSHSSGHRGHYGHHGHYRNSVPHRRRSLGCLGVFVVGAALAGSGVLGLMSLLS